MNKTIFSTLALLYVLLIELFLVANYFTGVGVNQATIMQLKFGLTGAPFKEYIWLITLIIGSLSLCIILMGIFVYIKTDKNISLSYSRCLMAYALLFVGLSINPACVNIYQLPHRSLISSMRSTSSETWEFYNYYKEPRIRRLETGQKNIVVIYAESLERAFFNEDIFPGLVPELKLIEKQSTSFSQLYTLPGINGTIWSIVASQCGVPLYLPSMSFIKNPRGDFLPDATCLGDLLANEDYFLAYYGGAKLNFTRKGEFFKSHGFIDVFGRNALRSKLEDTTYLNHWGLYDDSLFDISYKRFLELSESGTKFGLFLLTVDTHAPGYPSKSCEDKGYLDGSNKHLNAVKCADFLISDFIRKIADSPYGEQTVIVVASDHYNYRNTPAYKMIKQARGNEGKKNLFMIFEPGKVTGKEIHTLGTHMDIGTTILPFMGYSGQIGLGRDLLKEGERIVKERDYIADKLFTWKPEILKFWGPNIIKQDISIDTNKKMLTINNKKYELPVFLELTEDLFVSHITRFKPSVVAHIQRMAKKDKFLWIDDCKDIKLSDMNVTSHGTVISNDGWCLITGQDSKYIHKTRLDGKTTYNMNGLRRILNMN
ncbi:sulfatase-like hydrolase/transferase [Desulforhopalus sp. IMCC35007]|uniref:sulfatase-like hydrolase/transferase n=1 Tax=Desulforhopalus sp. IMCC35007 TaxID=2569543 RepID=UPI00145E6632|nr:sulfatase-like hydrolase/transferase [Desulforhopalus sp. IMCC35007]